MIPRSLSILSQGLDKVNPEFIRDWIIVFCCFIGMLWMLRQFAGSFKKRDVTEVNVSPSPLQVEEVEKLATKAELQQMRAEVLRDVDGVRRALDEERRTYLVENGKLHHRVDEVVETLAETKGLLIGVKENTDRLLQRSMK